MLSAHCRCVAWPATSLLLRRYRISGSQLLGIGLRLVKNHVLWGCLIGIILSLSKIGPKWLDPGALGEGAAVGRDKARGAVRGWAGCSFSQQVGCLAWPGLALPSLAARLTLLPHLLCPCCCPCRRRF